MVRQCEKISPVPTRPRQMDLWSLIKYLSAPCILCFWCRLIPPRELALPAPSHYGRIARCWYYLSHKHSFYHFFSLNMLVCTMGVFKAIDTGSWEVLRSLGSWEQLAVQSTGLYVMAGIFTAIEAREQTKLGW